MAKTTARSKKFWKAFGEAQAAFLRSWAELSRLVEELRKVARSAISQLGVDTLGLLDGRSVQIFEANCGLILFYSDGSAYYAPRPQTI